MSSEIIKGSKGILLYNTNIRYSMVNILDQQIEEINVPVLKPVKITKSQPQSLKQLAGMMASSVQKRLNNFSDWILGYVPTEIKKTINIHVDTLKKEINKIYENLKVKQHESNNKTSKIVLKQKALKGFLKSYIIDGDIIDPKIYLEDNKHDVINLLKNHEKPIKMKFLLECQFYKKE